MPSVHEIVAEAGPVAVYRWFADGEGWAYHPWYVPYGAELSRALDQPLKGPTGPFAIAALGGYLIGENLPDPDCLDSKARDRHPIILRVAFVAGPPTASQRQELHRALQQVSLPVEPGQHPELLLDPERWTPPYFPIAQPADRASRERWILGLVLGILLVCGAVAAWWLRG